MAWSCAARPQLRMRRTNRVVSSGPPAAGNENANEAERPLEVPRRAPAGRPMHATAEGGTDLDRSAVTSCARYGEAAASSAPLLIWTLSTMAAFCARWSATPRIAHHGLTRGTRLRG